MIRIEGIYDLRTMKQLQDFSEVKSFDFDFRPTSFNFLQQYKMLEILEASYDSKSQYFLHYRDEKDFVIKKMIDDLKEFFSTHFGSLGIINNFFLEFSDENEFSFYDQFDQNYYWHYNPKRTIKEVRDAKYLKGICLDHSFLEDLHNKGQLYQFVQNFTQSFLPMMFQKKMGLILRVDWDDNIIPSLLDYFDFEFVSLSLNSKVEICYRNVDLNRMKKGLNYLGGMVNEYSDF